MRSVKFAALMMLAALTLGSCESGSTGTTIVEFANTRHSDGFGSGWIYVPITLSGTEMNTSDVTVAVEVVDFETEHTKAVKDVDYQISSTNLVFRPGVTEAALEIELMETNPEKLPDVMEFKLVISNSNTNIGAKSECVVHLEKTTADRLCGQWHLTYEGYNPNYGDLTMPMLVNVTWNANTQRFSMMTVNDNVSVYGAYPISMIFDEENGYIILPAYELITWYDSSKTIGICQFLGNNITEVTTTDGTEMIASRAGDDIIGTYSEDFKKITFEKSESVLAIGYTYMDEAGNPTEMHFWGSGLINISLVRPE